MEVKTIIFLFCVEVDFKMLIISVMLRLRLWTVVLCCIILYYVAFMPALV